MKHELLSNLFDIHSGGTPSRHKLEYYGGDIPWVKISDIENAQNGIINFTEESITTEGLSSIGNRVFPAGTLFLAMYGSVGKVAFSGKRMSTNQASLGLRRKSNAEVSSQFLFYWFKANKAQLGNLARGGILKNLSATIVKKIQIPLPPLEDQVRIAHLLGKVEGLIAQRKKDLSQLDQLLKSVFLEMFGDPVRNEKGWETDSLINFGSFKNGLNFRKSESGIKVRYLGVGNFGSLSKISDMQALSHIDLDESPSKEYFLRNGDIIFVRSNGNPKLVGRCIAIYPNSEKVTFSGFCIRYRIENSIANPIYLSHMFRSSSFRKALLQEGQGANIQNINQKILASFKIPLPPSVAQNLFGDFVEKVETLQSHYQTSLSDLESLYGVLSQKAFQGELDLSNMPIPLNKPIPHSDTLNPILELNSK